MKKFLKSILLILFFSLAILFLNQLSVNAAEVTTANTLEELKTAFEEKAIIDGNTIKLTDNVILKDNVVDITEKEETEKNEMEDAMAQSNKMMSWMMPIMSVSISLVAPLGLALYWLINNILMIGERLILNKLVKD